MNRKELVPIQLLPLSDNAIVLQFGEEVSEEIHAKIQAVAHYLEQHPLPGMQAYVPAYTTLTVYYDPWVTSNKGKTDPYDAMVAQLQQVLSETKKHKRNGGRLVEIPVCYGGEYGPDLEEVVGYTNLSHEEVIALHSGTTYLVHMMGFAPGFPYLGGLNDRIATPRRHEPRKAIPKGSVGIAGQQTGIYPIETPGGWQLIGQTPLELFNPDRAQPSLLRAGDKVRFVPISEDEFKHQAEQHEH